MLFRVTSRLAVRRSNATPQLSPLQTVSYRSYAEDTHATPPSFNETKIHVNFSSPQSVLAQGDFDWLSINSTAGLMSIYPNHVPSVSELRPGLIQVAAGDKVDHFFASGGFCFVHRNSNVDISVLEAVPLEQLDLQAAQSALDEATRQVTSAKTDVERAEAEIAVEVNHSIVQALQK